MTAPFSKSLDGTAGRARHPTVVMMAGTFPIYSLTTPLPHPNCRSWQLPHSVHERAYPGYGPQLQAYSGEKEGGDGLTCQSSALPPPTHTLSALWEHTQREPQVAHVTCLEPGFCTGLCYVHRPEVDRLAPAPVPAAWFCLPDLFCDLRDA